MERRSNVCNFHVVYVADDEGRLKALGRVHGIRKQDWDAMQQAKYDQKRIMREYHSRVHVEIPLPIACTCWSAPYPHVHEGDGGDLFPRPWWKNKHFKNWPDWDPKSKTWPAGEKKP